MAELSRVRPDLNETEEQLLELQRAFLASQDHRANAAARVTRVGGAPPKEPSPENLAGVLPEDIRRAEAARAAVDPSATPTSHAELDSFGTGPAHGLDPTAEIREVVGEVIERAPSRTGAPIPPTAPTAPGPGLAFPEAKHRTKGPFAERPKSKFMLERERKAAEAAAAAAGGTVAVAGASPQPPQPTPSTTTARHPLDESKGIEEETARRLAAMSVSEIEDAQSTIAAKLKPSALEFFRKRGADKLSAKSKPVTEEAPAPPAAAAESGADAAKQQPPRALPPASTPPTSPPRSTKKPPLSPARPIEAAPAAPQPPPTPWRRHPSRHPSRRLFASPWRACP